MTKQEISTFCVDQLAEILRLPKEQVDVNAKFTRLGLDSAMTVYLLMELEDRLDLELSPETFYDHPTVDALSAHIGEKVAARTQRAAARYFGLTDGLRLARLRPGTSRRDTGRRARAGLPHRPRRRRVRPHLPR